METKKYSHIDYIYHAWDAALSENNVEKLLCLYHPEAIIESPLIPHIMGKPQGICRGLDEIRLFIELIALRKPEPRKFYRYPYFTDGKMLIWEYPRLTPTGEQMDFIEIMELENALIKYHRVYWGWYGFNIIQTDAYRRKD